MSNLIKRAIFGGLYVGLILAALLLGSHTLYMVVFG
ncbi:MAG: phosphatidate cytidylyltransferase, partial [Porphyromonadaceae bacterium]|nr:phosphatidate cytidylyltransferase [Porphyromonadaceae bacterium]